MPTVLNMYINGEKLSDVVGSAKLARKSVRVSESLDGSSLNISSSRHIVTFTVPERLLRWFQPMLQLNSEVRFSGDYSTGETVKNAIVQVLGVNPLDRGEIEYILSVSPNEAVVRESEPGL